MKFILVIFALVLSACSFGGGDGNRGGDNCAEASGGKWLACGKASGVPKVLQTLSFELGDPHIYVTRLSKIPDPLIITGELTGTGALRSDANVGGFIYKKGSRWVCPYPNNAMVYPKVGQKFIVNCPFNSTTWQNVETGRFEKPPSDATIVGVCFGHASEPGAGRCHGGWNKNGFKPSVRFEAKFGAE